MKAKKKKKKIKKKSSTSTTSLLKRINTNISKKSKWVFVFIAIMSTIVAGLLFDAFINPMADDANFLVQSNQLINSNQFPSYSSVLYIIVLSVVAVTFGFNVISFKFASFIFALIGLTSFYYLHKKRFPSIAFLITLFFIGSNFGIQYYSSSTMSEAFFMMFQIFFLSVAYYAIDISADNYNTISAQLKEQWRHWMGIGLFLALFSLTKNIAVISPLVLILFFLIYKKYNSAIFTLGSFLLFRMIYTGFRLVAYGEAKRSGQWDSLLVKNYYDRNEGTEDLMGLVIRYLTNLDYHISTDFMRFLGFRPNIIGIQPMTLITIVVVALLLYLLYTSFKKNKFLFFLGLYLFFIMSVVFVSLQTHWKQDRMILVFVPFLILFFTGTAYNIAIKQNKYVQYTYLVIILLLGFTHLRHLPAQIQKNNKNFKALLSGDIYGGYTPDWQNYLKMSRWISDNLEPHHKVACRKGNTSVIYGGGKDMFFQISRSTKEGGQKALEYLQSQNITHIMACNLRANPTQAVEGQIIGTIHTYTQALYNYNNNIFRHVHTVGDSEPCHLYEIIQ